MDVQFSSLPDDMLHAVMQLVDGPDLGRLSQVCKHLYAACGDSVLWFKLCQRLGVSVTSYGDEQSQGFWKTLYVTSYLHCGSIIAFGSSGNRRCGIHSSSESAKLPPTRISDTIYSQISASWYHNVALDLQHRVWMLPGRAETLEQVPNLAAVKISCNTDHSMALGTNGNIYTWGDNSNGQLGVPAGPKSFDPLLVDALLDEQIVDIGAMEKASLALTASGQLYGWGRLVNTHKPQLVHVRGMGKIVRVFAGQTTVVLLDENGQTALLRGTDQKMIPLQAGKKVVHVASGVSCILLVTSDGELFQVRTLAQDLLETTQILAGHYIVDASSGNDHNIAVTINGEAYGWGDNSWGQVLTILY
eukprot:TRINITY_DN548_c0_g1_i2.p1 TRINITY_DN548_c0_g1~~TRINITY_DN548_c0_g1_i2.p1  ORF type:complete len:360 (+),score=39.26 TRINITY_DN548_c0_g1_i2:74-1153(+)